MKIAFTIALLNALFAVGSFVGPPISLTIKPTVLRNRAIPARGLLSTAVVSSLLHCAFLCVQKINCWRYSFGNGSCSLYEPVHPVPKPEFLESEGYTTYQARKKIFKVIKGGFSGKDANDVCKNNVGGRLACLTDVNSFQLFKQFLVEEFPNTYCGQTRVFIGLRSVGTEGIFTWYNGETIDVVNGTGLQSWPPGSQPKRYKTGNVLVASDTCKEKSIWYEENTSAVWHPCCETP